MPPGNVLAIFKAAADSAVSADRRRVIAQQIYDHAIRNLLVTTKPAQPLRGAFAPKPRAETLFRTSLTFAGSVRLVAMSS